MFIVSNKDSGGLVSLSTIWNTINGVFYRSFWTSIGFLRVATQNSTNGIKATWKYISLPFWRATVSLISTSTFPANIYLFKVNNINIRKNSEICLNSTIKTPERRQLSRSGVCIVNFEHISLILLVFPLSTFNR